MSALLAGAQGAAFALLLLGHVLGDFAFQTRRMVHGKHRWRPLIAHVGIITLTHLATLAIFLTPATAGLVLVIALTHLVIDAGKARLDDPADPTLGIFLTDQALHLIVLVLAALAFPERALITSPILEAVDGIPYQGYTLLTTGAVYISAFVFVHHGGNAIVRAVLPEWDPGRDGSAPVDLGAGRTIGTLERWIVLLLVLANQWAAVGLVIAAKSIARFEELKKRPFAEYFLVGTLASVLVAIVAGLVARLLV